MAEQQEQGWEKRKTWQGWQVYKPGIDRYVVVLDEGQADLVLAVLTNHDRLVQALREIVRHVHEEPSSEASIVKIAGDALDALKEKP